eukprot:jgi/Psemu1/13480/gm1.13480_g
MVFSKVHILQALQAKLKSQPVSPTNPVDPNPSVSLVNSHPSVPPSATSPSSQEDDGIDLEPDSDSDPAGSDSDCKITPEYQKWDFTVSLESDSKPNSRDDLVNLGWNPLLSLHGIERKRIPD